MLSGDLSARFLKFLALGVSLSSEHFAAAHVVVAVASTVWVILERGVVGMVHGSLPPLELSATASRILRANIWICKSEVAYSAAGRCPAGPYSAPLRGGEQ